MRETFRGGAPRRGCASISSICSASGMACAMSRATWKKVGRCERAGGLEAVQEPRCPFEQGVSSVGRSSVNGMDDSEGRASGGSPAARVADDPMQHAGCDEPPVLRGGADVIDRCQFAGEGLGGGVRRLGCRSPAVQG